MARSDRAGQEKFMREELRASRAAASEIARRGVGAVLLFPSVGLRVTARAAGAGLASSFAANCGMRVAGFAVQEVVEGRHVPTHDLVVSLRHFIREALDLEPIPTDLRIPRQGPTRPQSSGGKSKASGSEDSSGRGGRGGQRGGGGGAGGGGAGMAGLDDENESANDR